MNTAGNARYTETEKRIKDSFIDLLSVKELDMISVSDICKKSGLSRPTFYSHYDDINDLVYQMEREKAKQIEKLLISSECSLLDKLTKYFEFLEENSTFYKAYFLTESNALLVAELMNAYKSKLSWEKAESSVNYYHMIFFKAGIRAVASNWLRNGCKEAPVIMAKLLEQEMQYFIERRTH